MPELIWIVDPTTGDLAVEGLRDEEALSLAGDLLPPPQEFNCARPLATMPLLPTRVSTGPTLRVAAFWHASVAEGPGRRSVLQVQGCPVRCSPVIYSTGLPVLSDGLLLPDVVTGALCDTLFVAGDAPSSKVAQLR